MRGVRTGVIEDHFPVHAFVQSVVNILASTIYPLQMHTSRYSLSHLMFYLNVFFIITQQTLSSCL